MKYIEITRLDQLEALPCGAIIKAGGSAGAMEKFDLGWAQAGSHVMYQAALVPLSALLLWQPETQEERRQRRLRLAQLATEVIDGRSPELRSGDPATFRARVDEIYRRLLDDENGQYEDELNEELAAAR